MNQRMLLTGVWLCLGASVSAQSYVTSPSGYLSTSGGGHSDRFGTGSISHRHQLIDGNFRSVPMMLKGISFRADNHDYRAFDGLGRSWSNVTLSMARSDFDKVMRSGTDFSTTPTSTPTLVFRGSVTWPTMSGNPGNPAPWGGVRGEYSFPFGSGGTASTWAHTGAEDILADFSFSGCTLANRGPLGMHAYYLDGNASVAYAYAEATLHGPSGSQGGCADPSVPTTSGPQGAMNTFELQVFGPYNPPPYANIMVADSYAVWTAPNAPVVHAYAFNGSAAGWAFPGVSCQKLYLDPAAIFAIAVAMADSNSRSRAVPVNPSGAIPGSFPVTPQLMGVDLWNQCAWNDSRSGAVRLTRAMQIRLPVVDVSSRNAALYESVPNGVHGPRADNDIPCIPLLRYER